MAEEDAKAPIGVAPNDGAAELLGVIMSFRKSSLVILWDPGSGLDDGPDGAKNSSASFEQLF